MAQMIFCTGDIVIATSGGRPTTPPNVVACTVPWTYETYTAGDLAKIEEITMYTHEIFDLLFVLALCFSFYMGFHKGGQR